MELVCLNVKSFLYVVYQYLTGTFNYAPLRIKKIGISLINLGIFLCMIQAYVRFIDVFVISVMFSLIFCFDGFINKELLINPLKGKIIWLPTFLKGNNEQRFAIISNLITGKYLYLVFT